MDDLLLNDYEIQKAIDAELDEYYFEDKIPRYSRERCVAQAQIDKIRAAGYIHTVRAERLAKERLAEEKVDNTIAIPIAKSTDQYTITPE